MKNPFKSFVAVLLLSFMLTGCTQVREIVNKYESEPTEAVKITYESEYTYLTDSNEILEMLITTMKANKSSCSFNVETEDLINADMWMAKLGGINKVSVEYTKVQNGYNVYVTLDYWDNYPLVFAHQNNDTTGLTARQLELLDRYYEIIGKCITKDMTAYEKELAIHDYLVQNIEYDTTKSAEHTHTAYGALILGRAVCDGYAESFKTLMDLVGIESIIIKGEGNGESHGWNLVKLDGAWYHVDVTWDDPIGANGNVSHAYFNISDTEMAGEHIWDRTNYPPSSGNKYSYYLMGDIVQVYNQEEFNSYITECIGQHKETIEVVVHARVDLEEALRKAGISLSYSYNIIERGIFRVYQITITY